MQLLAWCTTRVLELLGLPGTGTLVISLIKRIHSDGVIHALFHCPVYHDLRRFQVKRLLLLKVLVCTFPMPLKEEMKGNCIVYCWCTTQLCS